MMLSFPKYVTHKEELGWQPHCFDSHEKGIKDILGKKTEIYGYATMFGIFGSNKGYSALEKHLSVRC